jgi:hypothetical protein
VTREEWAREALRREAVKVESTSHGRHTQVYAAAAAVAPYVRDGVVTADVVESEIVAAATRAGLDAARLSEARRTVRDGLAKAEPVPAWYPSSTGAMHGPTVVPWRGRMLVTGGVRGSVVSDVIRRTMAGPAPAAPGLHPLRAVVYPERLITAGTLQTWTWEDLAAMLAEPEDWPGDKNALPLWTAAELEDDDRGKRPDGIDIHTGAERERPPVCIAVHALVLDYDDDPEWSIAQTGKWWAGVSWLAHTSASHNIAKGDATGPRGRVIVPLSRAVTEEEHMALAAWVQSGAFGKPGAKELKNPRRGYYVPSRAPGGYEYGAELCGRSLDVDAILRLTGEAEAAVDDGRQLAHQTTPDGRPYLVRVPGSQGWYLATARGGFAIVDDVVLRTELRRHWPELELDEEDENGVIKPLGVQAIYARYGTRARSLVYTYVGQSRVTYLADHDVELVLRVCDREPPPPVRHGDVLEWLHVLCGDRVDTVLDWLATCTELSQPTAALVLIGEGSSGKSMLATGLAAYYGADVADYDDVFKGRFNDALLRSPVVFLDENTQTESRSAGFRKLTANRVHGIEAKGKPSCTLQGCPRLIVASNDPDPLRLSREALTLASEQAIGMRVVSIDCCKGAPAWLEERGGNAYTADWVTREGGAAGKLGELIAWLRDHRTVRKGSRFLVTGSSTEWAARIGTREGLPSTILDAIARWLDDDKARSDLQRMRVQPVITDPAIPGKALVSNRGLRDSWEALIGDRPPTHRQVADALRRLSGEEDSSRQVTLYDGTRSPRGALVPLTLLADRRENT